MSHKQLKEFNTSAFKHDWMLKKMHSFISLVVVKVKASKEMKALFKTSVAKCFTGTKQTIMKRPK